MNKNNENTNAFLIHISAFAGYFFPLGSIIAPLILWQTQKDKSQFIDEQGKEAVNFNISYVLYTFILGVSAIPFAFNSLFNHFRHYNDFNFDFNFNGGHFFGFFGIASLITILGFIKVILIILAALKSKEGENYKYPLTIKFIK
ncbi:orotate phosphoribosyltransferase [Polaribacter pacificus]|uniref:Orotate phosphoribosyltransferase n=1 Tax=Polaribacter pacificus TaxID=1775173 RepID=A0A917I1C3_9FLAO|nr:DUF4870 domain-containing protein [Polaribacter pacificus]GGH00812.1 orotate phosphoribosyltransferase [Polaribacter pacificus]